ncbi:hypothetical protein GCM10025876_17760 [Demequina litorisediminis]|uniref:Alpha-1,4 glucan phosphorylase n=1 Tax=Demequina litorisediminis TaxID=1849022 RepID=A0ABQ6IFR4_9MICO|nr:hypothetical protein GCM10025876_17760 [Demequina litorisediminis]
MSLYERITTGRLALADVTPRTFVFGAKAAPGYVRAKETIALINHVGATINADASLEGRLKVAFPANYNVTLAEKAHPGIGPVRADLAGGQGGVRNRQHEVRAQRCPHHRHGRRR